MTRITFGEHAIEPADIPAKPKRLPSRRRRILGCCLPFVLFFLIFIFFVAAVVAKTGVVNIPYITPMLYHVPVPQRVVPALDQRQMAKAGVKTAIDPLTKTVQLELTEQQLTFILRQALSGKPDSFFAPSIQATLEPSGIEFFGLLTKPISANITLTAKPTVVNGQLALLPSIIKIGTLELPFSWITWVDQNFLHVQLSGQLQRVAMVQATSVTVEHQRIIITLPLSSVSNQAVLNQLLNQ